MPVKLSGNAGFSNPDAPSSFTVAQEDETKVLTGASTQEKPQTAGATQQPVQSQNNVTTPELGAKKVGFVQVGNSKFALPQQEILELEARGKLPAGTIEKQNAERQQKDFTTASREATSGLFDQFLGQRPIERGILSPEAAGELDAELANLSTGALFREGLKDTLTQLRKGKLSYWRKKRNKRIKQIFFGRLRETERKAIGILPAGIGTGLQETFGFQDPDEVIRNFEQKLEPYTQDPTNILSDYNEGFLTQQQALIELNRISEEIDFIEQGVKEQIIKDYGLVVNGVAQPIQSDLADARKETFDAAQSVLTSEQGSPSLSRLIEEMRKNELKGN